MVLHHIYLHYCMISALPKAMQRQCNVMPPHCIVTLNEQDLEKFGSKLYTIWHLSTFAPSKRGSEPVVTALLYYCLQLGSRKIRTLKKLGNQKILNCNLFLGEFQCSFVQKSLIFSLVSCSFQIFCPLGACLRLPKSASVKLRLQLSGHPSYGGMKLKSS